MKSACIVLCLVMLSLSSAAQKVFFLYLQTPDQQPFYVRMDDRIFSSAASGYLIIPNLRDSTYQLVVGFPTQTGESQFTVKLSGKDRGFLIRQFKEGLGLFDLQSLSIIHARKDESRSGTSYQRREDAFTLLLSKAAADSSLLFVPVAAKETAISSQPPALVKADPPPAPVADPMTVVSSATSPASQVKDTIAGSDVVFDPQTSPDSSAALLPRTDSSAASVQVPALTAAVPYKKSTVRKYAESSTSEGFGLVFYDIQEGGTDTIRLLIPNPRFVFKQPEAAADTGGMLEIRPRAAINTEKGSACKSVASDSDFLRARRKMAAQSSDEEMVNEARNEFDQKCFTTEQIRNLGVLFLTAAGRYEFFKAARPHLSDPEQFASLGTEIRDEYYSKRFKDLVAQ